MRSSILLGSVATCLSLGCVVAARAATTPDTTPAAAQTAAVVPPAKACATDIRAFSNDMHKNGYWVGESDYDYGYPMGGYGYDGGNGYTNSGVPLGIGTGYADTRPGYELRSLLASANILARNGAQAACDAVLRVARTIYTRETAELAAGGTGMTNGTVWQRSQIAGATPVTNQTAAFRSDQLIDTEVRNADDVALGSVHDLVISPKTGKIAYLIVGRGGIFGFDETYVPVPWTDFKVTANANVLVLDTTAVAMTAAPTMTDAQFTAKGDFAQQSGKVDAYWQTTLATKPSN